jgi:hypothetical protein
MAINLQHSQRRAISLKFNRPQPISIAGGHQPQIGELAAAGTRENALEHTLGAAAREAAVPYTSGRVSDCLHQPVGRRSESMYTCGNMLDRPQRPRHTYSPTAAHVDPVSSDFERVAARARVQLFMHVYCAESKKAWFKRLRKRRHQIH